MTHYRTITVITGTLFIIATITALVAAQLEPARVGSAEYVLSFVQHPYLVAVSACMYLLAAGTSVGIAIALYPLLKKVSPAAALGAVLFRTIEAVFYSVAVLGLLAVSSMTQQFMITPADTYRLIDVVLHMRDHATLVGVMSFCVGALLYYSIFYRARLVPRWLAGWGIVGALAMFVACLAALFSGNPVTGYMLLIIPILLQEMVFAVWLLVKGVDASHMQHAECVYCSESHTDAIIT